MHILIVDTTPDGAADGTALRNIADADIVIHRYFDGAYRLKIVKDRYDDTTLEVI